MTFESKNFLFYFYRDPMEALMLEQHMRSPFGIFPDPIMAQLMQQDADNASAVFLEKARQHLQIFGRTPYTDLLMPQVYQRQNFGGLNLGLWQNQWPPQIAGGFLNNNSAPRTTPSPASTSISSGSPPLDMRAKHFQRFSPYQVPQNHSPKPESPP
jgi:T-box protein 20